jgi:uroporphyrinogen-III synthase
MNETPLTGRRILITRTQEGSARLAERLRALGAEPIEIPLIRILPPASYAPLDEALARLREYDVLLVTSATTARVLSERKPAPWETQPFTAVIGPATAEAVRSAGLRVDLQPSPSVAESLLRELIPRAKGQRMLLPRAKVARETLPQALRAAGARVDVVTAYETVAEDSSRPRLLAMRDPNGSAPDAITFTSASTVHSFFTLMGDAQAKTLLAQTRVFSIGPLTTDALKTHGVRKCIQAEAHDLDGLVDCLLRALR